MPGVFTKRKQKKIELVTRPEIHQKTVEILKPQIQGIYDMVEFVQESIKEFATGASGIKTLILMLKMDEGFVSQVRGD